MSILQHAPVAYYGCNDEEYVESYPAVNLQ
jgi:hypothetical protein